MSPTNYAARPNDSWLKGRLISGSPGSGFIHNIERYCGLKDGFIQKILKNCEYAVALFCPPFTRSRVDFFYNTNSFFCFLLSYSS